MRIVIDGRMIGWTGIGRYTKNLLGQLESLDHDNTYIVLINQADKDKWAPSAANFSVRYVSILPYSVAEQWRLPLVLWQLKPDLVHFHHFAVPLVYQQPFVVTVHDMTLVDYKNYRGEGVVKWVYEVKYWASRWALRHAVRASRLVITPTKYVRDRLTEHFHLTPDRITATLLGFSRLSHDGHTFPPADPPYLFALGNSYPYKNLRRLVEAYQTSDFKRRGGQLILAGPEDYFRGVLRDELTAASLMDGVRFIGRVSDDELIQLYSQTSLYIFPSLSEGFGLPGIEAMSYGVPVLAAKATALPEVYGEAAAYFEPQSTADLTAQIDRLTTDEAARQALVEASRKRLKRFSWKAAAEQTLAGYRVAARKKKADA